MQQVINVPKQQQVADIHHHRDTDDLMRCFKVAKMRALPQEVRIEDITPARLLLCSDQARAIAGQTLIFDADTGYG